MNRKDFLRSIIGVSAFFALPFGKIDDDRVLRAIDDVTKPVRGSMYGFKDKPINKVKVGLIGSGNRGQML